MWPWGHVAVGYLLLTVVWRVRGWETPTDSVVFVLGVATLLPDLIDKPLVWYVGILPYGRTLAHSLLTGGLFVGLVVWYARFRDRSRVGDAFALGYLSHLGADGLAATLRGDWHELGYLAWPLTAAPMQDSPGLLERLVALELTPYLAFQFGLAIGAILLWAQHGFPGVGLVRHHGRSLFAASD